MTRKTKRVIARILAVVMAVTLVPSNMWGTAGVVMAEEVSEAFMEEDDDVIAEDVQAMQGEVEEKEASAAVNEEEPTPVAADETVEDDKVTEVKEGKTVKESVTEEADNKSVTATGIHYHNFTESMTLSDEYFKIDPITEKTDVPEIKYTDKSGQALLLTKAIDVSNDNSVTIIFEAETPGTLVLVTGVSRKWNVTAPGAKKSGITSNSEGVLEVQSSQGGQWELSKNAITVLYYIAFIPEGSEPVVETVKTPIVSPDDGAVVKLDDFITLSCETEGADIYYTINNGEASLYSDSGIAIEDGMQDRDNDNKITITAYAKKDGWNDSSPVTVTYILSMEAGEGQLEMPIADPDSGEVPRGTKVLLTKGDEDIESVSIYYTLDKTITKLTKDNGVLFKETEPIVINEDTTIKAIATAEGKDDSNPAVFTYTIKKPTIKVNDDDFSQSVISDVVIEGNVVFTNGTKEEVFDISIKAVESTDPDDTVKAAAEKIKEEGEGGQIIYYDFLLVNNESTSDTVSIEDGIEGTLKIKMPYTIASDVTKRNKISVVNATGEIETSKDTDGFVFNTDSIGSYAVVINPADAVDDIIITESAGYEEGAYAEWEAIEDADGYVAYVALAGGEFTRIDNELIREYEDYWRVDTVGLAKGTYYIKIDAVILGMESGEETATVISSNMTRALNVKKHDRSGYAWVNGTSSGAYNEDGTLKADANVIYVTETTKDTVELNVTGAESNPCVGLQNILNGYKKLAETKPLDVRIIGNVTGFEVMEAGDIVISGSGATKRLSAGITVEGIGEDTVANGWGIRIKNASNVEIRNLGFMNCDSDERDNVGLQQDNDHVWVHHCDMFYGKPGGDSDQAKGDGALDVKKSSYVTFSYNHFWDSGKCNLAGLNQENTDMYLTYHHNWYDHSDSRHPRIRYFTTHIYNNYYDGNSKYGVGAAKGGPSVFVENNYFRNCPYPMLISMQGSDVWDGSKNNYGTNATFSKEDGGIIKAYGNIIEGENRFIPYSATDDPATAWDESVDFDAYVVENRNDTVPSTVKTVTGVTGLKGDGGNTYSNFDTALDFYDYTPDDAKDVPTIVMAGAGRVNGGDFKWEFDDATQDKNSGVIVELQTALLNYKSLVKAIGGNVNADVKVIQNDPGKAPDNVASKDVSAPTASKLTNTEVAKGDTITLECATSGAEIYYTINGGRPTKDSTPYTGAITITDTGVTTIRAVAYVGDDCSDVSVFKYTVPGGGSDSDDSSGDDTVITPPSATPSSGDLKKGESVQLSAAGDIYYTMTTDGSDPDIPTTSSDKCTTAITITAEAGATVKIKAITVSDGKSSAPALFTYTIVEGTPEITEKLSNPEASPAPVEEETYPIGMEISLISREEGTIYYTLDGADPQKEDGEPSETSVVLAENETIVLDRAGTYTIKAFAVKDGYLPSDTVTFTYTVSEDSTLTQLAQPVITPASKEVEMGDQITVTITNAKDDPADTEIYYTTDGTAPGNKEELRYTEPFTITVNKTTTINAIAVKDGLISSTTASVTYAVKEDNTPNPPAGTGLRVVLKNKNEVYTYTGSAIKPDIEVWNNSDKLVEGVDYTVKYKNNVNVSANVNENKKPQITVTGKGNLTGSAFTTFEIAAKPLIDSDVAVAGIDKDDTLGEMLLVVENTKPAPALYYGGAKLSKKDYTVSLTDKCVAGDTGKEITITGTGNFSGTLTYKLKVIKKDELKKFAVTFTAPDYTYNGSAQKFTLAEGDVKDNSKTDTDGRKLTLGTDYTIVYQSDTTNAGKVKFTVVGLGYYTGAVAKTYTIKPLAATSGFTFTGVDTSYPYAGTGVTIPAAGITYNGTALEEGRDYKLTYGNNKRVGTAKITAAFMGNYKGSKIDPKTFEIKQGMLDNQTEGLKIAIADKIYNKPGVYKSAPYISVNGVEVKSSEYTVKYYTGIHADGSIDANTEMGSKNKVELSDTELNKPVYVEITGKGKNYAANMKLTASYKVYKVSGSVVDLSKAKLTVCKDWNVTDTTDKANKTSKMEYTGMSIEPGVMIELKDGNNTTLSPKQVKELMDAENPQITVQYVNNVNKGKATIVINGDGVNYVGGKTITFSITTKSLKNTNLLMNLFTDIDKIIKG